MTGCTPSPLMGEGRGGGGVSAGTALYERVHPHPASPIEGEEKGAAND